MKKKEYVSDFLDNEAFSDQNLVDRRRGRWSIVYEGGGGSGGSRIIFIRIKGTRNVF